MKKENPLVPVMIPRELHEQFKLYCDEHGTKIQFAATAAIKNYLATVKKG